MVHTSLIIPCYRDAALLREHFGLVREHLDRSGHSYEVIISDDGTEDGSVAEFAKEQGFTYLRSETNQGKGAAVKKGMLEAKGSHRLFTDADIPFEPTVIDDIIRGLDEGYDMVAGDRTLDESTYYGMIRQEREWGSKIFRFIAGRLVAGGMYDTQCGIKGFRAEAAQELFGLSRIKGFAFDVEIYYLALKKAMGIRKIPVVLRSNRNSSVSVIRHGMGMIIDLFVIVGNYYRGLYGPRRYASKNQSPPRSSQT